MVSDLEKNGLICLKNCFEKKVRFQVFKFYVFLLFCTFFSKQFLRHIKPFFSNSETTFSKQFSLNNFFCFLFKAQNYLEMCVNCAWNCVTPLFTPLEVQFSQNIFFKIVLLPHLNCKTCSEGDIWKILRRRITDLKNQGPYKSQFCKKWVGTLHFWKNGMQSTFTWPHEP